MSGNKLKITIVLILITLNFFAQDTMRFNNGTTKVVKITEVGVDQVKYHLFNNLEGPIYINDKSEISLIKYVTGEIDAFRDYSNPVATQTFTPRYDPKEKILMRGHNLYFEYRRIGENQLKVMMMENANTSRKAKMLEQFIIVKDCKKKQYLFGFGGLVGAGVGLLCVSVLSDVNQFVAANVIGMSVGFGCLIGGEVFSVIFKTKRNKAIVRAAKIYNGDL